MDNLLLERILTMLDEDNHSTVFDFLVQTLRSTSPTHERHRASILTRIPDVLDLVAERSAGLLESSAVAVAAAVYQNDLLNLIQFNSGFHFKGSRACLEQLETFSIAQMGEKIQELAPSLWALLGTLLDANTSRRRVAPNEQMDIDEGFERELSDIATGITGNDEGSDDESDEDSDSSGEHDEGDGDEGDESETKPKRKYRKQNRARRNGALLFIVRTTL